jgi:hypothetical protein
MIPFADYMAIAWFLSNLITGLAYLWVCFEIGTWTADLPNYGTGFRVLSRLFQWFIGSCGVHHLVMGTLVWQYPTPFYMVATDMFVAVTALITAVALRNARRRLRLAFHTMLRYGSEWAEANR